MSDTPNREDEDDVREEYDFTPEQFRQAVRGKYAARYAKGVRIVLLESGGAEGSEQSTPADRSSPDEEKRPGG